MTCNQMRLHHGSNGVSLPTDLLLHGWGHLHLSRTSPSKGAAACGEVQQHRDLAADGCVCFV